MINHLTIRDFAVIENTSVDFNKGLNIITGETGAGKSVVIEGISLALGGRADSSFIRTGCSKAIVQLVGEIENKEYIISREISSNGKNICKLNGEIVTLAQLKETCQKLADIHGQYDNQFLFNPDNHIIFLDQFGKEKLSDIKEKVKDAFLEYSSVKSALSHLISDEREIKQKLDFYQFQLEDIDKLNLVIGEDEKLESDISLMENAEHIYSNLDKVYESIYSEAGCALDSLFGAMKSLEDISSYSKDIQSLCETFSDAYYNIEDLKGTIRTLKDSTSFSPSELNQAINRIEQINEAKKKYGNTIEEILSYRDKINNIIGEGVDFDYKKKSLEEDLLKKKENLLVLCEELTKLRKEVALDLESQIGKQLEELNFNNSQISVQFVNINEPTANGKETVEILISTNKGSELKPLAKIVSGGEMSRIMLAFKKIVSKIDGIPTLIFDEIDNGISGITASIVSKKLKEIAKDHQVICITHLPQIASCGDTNYRIVKTESNEKTFTTIEQLNDNEKIDEIARLLGGTNITSTTLESAKELINASK